MCYATIPTPIPPICSTSDSQIKPHFRLAFLPSPLRKQHHVLIPSPVGKVYGGVGGGGGRGYGTRRERRYGETGDAWIREGLDLMV